MIDRRGAEMNKPLKAHIFDRADDEWYCEPICVSTALFAAEKFDGGIWDPACGGGNILFASIEAGMHAIGTDIVDRGIRGMGRTDRCVNFFERKKLSAPNIVTNPPFGRAVLAEKFIRHAISLKPGKLAVFVDSRFMFGKARAAGLFAEFPPTRIWLITPRPSCPPGEYLAAGNKAGGGTADYCWVVWEGPSLGGRSDWGTRAGWLRCTP
jgi:hypothetical protein